MKDFNHKYDNDYVELRVLIESLIAKKWLILAVALCVCAFAVVYAALKPLNYQSSILLKIQHKESTALGTASDESLAVQIALIKSEYVLRPVIQQLGSTKLPESVALNRLQNSILVTDLSGAAENGLNKVAILRVTLSGQQPSEITKTLNQLADTIQQQNITLKVMSAEKNLKLLQSQLPIVKQSLKKSEQSLNAYQLSIDSIDTRFNKDALLAHLTDVNKELEKLDQEKTALLLKFTHNHPAVISASEEIHALENTRHQLISQLKSLPASEQEADHLRKEIDVNTTLYTALLDQIHQLEVIKTGIISDIEILSYAATPTPLQPISLATVSVASFLIGLMMACVGVLSFRLLTKSQDDGNNIHTSITKIRQPTSKPGFNTGYIQ